MKIEFWGDFACPFCYMGEHMLETVLKERSEAGEVGAEVRLRAYELDPEAPAVPEESMEQHFSSSHGISLEEARDQMARIVKMAARSGLECNLEGMQVCSTFDAHRLMKLAYEVAGAETAMRLSHAFFHANFVDNKRLSDHEVLKDIAVSVGLDPSEVDSVLKSDRYGDAVRADEKEADDLGLEFVPYLRFPEGRVLQGVLSVGAIRKSFQPK